MRSKADRKEDTLKIYWIDIYSVLFNNRVKYVGRTKRVSMVIMFWHRASVPYNTDVLLIVYIVFLGARYYK